MGVPALFRWLSKKYPKIVKKVVEDTPTKVRGENGDIVEVPLKYESANPNGFEVGNLYLDMNGIVHPCTHPEGKPAPETEEDMMVEIFQYTERVVNMARPRKVLMMAIGGVAPRAKMNQQRSRRFRAAQEAADKAEEQREAIKMYEAMGHTVSDETRNKKSWDSNAITPGTPFMDLLSISLKYWVSHKLSTDPGWKDLKIIISDSSVPGEGEHKIVDWIRRQRSYPEWDPNTSHVMYGLDADLIMLSLATHEPNFRVLREDVFAQGSKGPGVCKNCGEPGHFAANCLGEKLMKDPTVVEKAKPVDPKPFIFLDVSILREYLAVELVIANVPFPFNLELAIDDWIFMIFFVGNDFLPHLPSLEIREGAIDVLLEIWKNELPRMGGYLTNNGKVNLERAGIILEGLATREDGIFQKRKEDEERQESRQKRMRIEDHRRQNEAKLVKEASLPVPRPGEVNGTEYVAITPVTTARGGPLHPSLPTRPGFDIVPKEEAGSAGKEKKMTAAQREAASLNAGKNSLLEAQGSNEDVVANRRKIRMANQEAARLLRAGLDGDDSTAKAEPVSADKVETPVAPEPVVEAADTGASTDDIMMDSIADLVDGTPDASSKKRKVDDREEDESSGSSSSEEDEAEVEDPPNPEADQPVPKKKLKVNSDGTVDSVDDVRLWEPGYRERYYQSKFGKSSTDTEHIKTLTKCYMEGLCWVLEYYYQGVPAWDWYYPYHYAPFAADFSDVGSMDISFEVSQPFKPFAQLLGVFPAASRIHLPEPLQTLMINEDSPIIDFYPDDFEIDMNGKKMAWQGVALLPFIDQTRLLAALASKESELSADEKRRNRWGDSIMFVGEDNRLYDTLCSLYTLKASNKPIPLDSELSLGTSGAVLADPNCVPGSSFDSPLVNIEECPDLDNNRSLSVRYYFPRQLHPHESRILKGYRPLPPVLSESDRDWTRRGGHGNGHGGHGGHGGKRHQGPRHSGGYSGGPGMSGQGGVRRNQSYPDLRQQQQGQNQYGGYGAPPAPSPSGYGNGGGGGYGGASGYAPPAGGAGGSYGYGGGSYGGGGQYGGAAYASNPYGGGGYGGSGGYAANGGGYGGAAAYGQPPRNPYAAPPPNPYGAARPPFPPTRQPYPSNGRR